MGNVIVLDVAFLNKFIEVHIQEFAAKLAALSQDNDEGRAISFIAESKKDTKSIDSKKPLAIGPMAGAADVVDGAKLNEVIQGSAVELFRIIGDHTVLFEDIEQAMKDTVKLLEKARAVNLESITPDEFMDVFEDVESDLGNPGGEKED